MAVSGDQEYKRGMVPLLNNRLKSLTKSGNIPNPLNKGKEEGVWLAAELWGISIERLGGSPPLSLVYPLSAKPSSVSHGPWSAACVAKTSQRLLNRLSAWPLTHMKLT